MTIDTGFASLFDSTAGAPAAVCFGVGLLTGTMQATLQLT
jgi:hypothetical protein